MMKLFLMITAMVAMLVSCQSKDNQKAQGANPNSHEVKVEEVIQASNYTYLRVMENGKETWLAVSKQEVKKGDTYYYANELVMNNFPSKELGRTFETILFVQQFSNQPIQPATATPATGMQGVSPGSKQVAPPKKEIKVDPAEGGISIAQLFSKRNSFSGKKVKIRGEVVKFNPEIMGKNWAHIQDGTAADGDFDLTVTTMDQVKVGDVVVFEGSITLDKDFGAGYAYKVIMEDAKVLKK